MKSNRLQHVGWESFRPELFLGEPGRLGPDVGPRMLSLLRDFSPGDRVDLDRTPFTDPAHQEYHFLCQQRRVSRGG